MTQEEGRNEGRVLYQYGGPGCILLWRTWARLVCSPAKPCFKMPALGWHSYFQGSESQTDRQAQRLDANGSIGRKGAQKVARPLNHSPNKRMASTTTRIRSCSALSSLTKPCPITTAAGRCRHFSKREDHLPGAGTHASHDNNEARVGHTSDWSIPPRDNLHEEAKLKHSKQSSYARRGPPEVFRDTREYKMILDWSTQPTIGRESFDSPLRDIGKPPPETLPRDSFSLRSRPKLRYGQSLPSLSRQSESARNKDSGFDDNRRILVDSIREKSHTPSIAPKEPVKMAVSPSWTPESGPLFFERSFSFGDSSHARVTNVQDRSSALSYLQGLSKGSAQEKHHPEREFLYSPNVVLPALKSGFRIPYKLYYSSEAGKGNR